MRITLIGLGEVGRVLAEDLSSTDVVGLTAWDLAFADPASAAARNAAELPVRAAADAADAVSEAELVISAVTAANDLDAATSASAAIAPGCWFLDLNSASPGQKVRSAEVIEAAGARYVEAALMAPIHPKRTAAPMLLGGPHAADFAALAADLGFSNVRVFSDVVGPASATKLARSVIVKGLESLVTESMLTARAWGVEADVLASLDNLLPAADWPALAEYMIRRSVQHGARRAEEMDEAAVTVAGAGLEPLMATAAARRHEWAAAHDNALAATGLSELLDAIQKATT